MVDLHLHQISLSNSLYFAHNRRFSAQFSAPVFVQFVLFVLDRHCRPRFTGTAGPSRAALPLATPPLVSTPPPRAGRTASPAQAAHARTQRSARPASAQLHQQPTRPGPRRPTTSRPHHARQPQAQAPPRHLLPAPSAPLKQAKQQQLRSSRARASPTLPSSPSSIHQAAARPGHLHAAAQTGTTGRVAPAVPAYALRQCRSSHPGSAGKNSFFPTRHSSSGRPTHHAIRPSSRSAHALRPSDPPRCRLLPASSTTRALSPRPHGRRHLPRAPRPLTTQHARLLPPRPSAPPAPPARLLAAAGRPNHQLAPAPPAGRLPKVPTRNSRARPSQTAAPPLHPLASPAAGHLLPLCSPLPHKPRSTTSTR
nr:vegetative cell wall protein gp1-like [Lolium perenne]